MKKELLTEDIGRVIEVPDEVFDEYAFCFKTKTKNVSDKSEKYVKRKVSCKG